MLSGVSRTAHTLSPVRVLYQPLVPRNASLIFPAMQPLLQICFKLLRGKHRIVKAQTLLLMLLLLAIPIFAADSVAVQAAKSAGSALSNFNISSFFGNSGASDVLKAAEQASGVQLPSNLSQGIPGLPAAAGTGQPLPNSSQLPSAQTAAFRAPGIVITRGNLEELVLLAIVLVYVFAAGKIADFLQSSGKRITRREALFAPFAYLFVACVGAAAYFASGAWVPPQNTVITDAVFLVLIPAAIVIGLGAFVLHSFFRDRMNAWQCLDLSMHIILAPVFDGIRGYWTAFGAAAILVVISGFTYWSSGGNFSLVTLDFLLLSIVVSLYFLYRAIMSHDSDGRAANLVTMLTVLAPSVLRLFLRDVACALLSLIPLDFFRTCPLAQAGNEVTLALSVLATLVILVPIIPFIYALIVNLLRFLTVAEVLLSPERHEGAESGKAGKEAEKPRKD